MTLQHLDKPLPNHAGSAQNPNRKLIAHKEGLSILQQPLFREGAGSGSAPAQKLQSALTTITSRASKAGPPPFPRHCSPATFLPIDGTGGSPCPSCVRTSLPRNGSSSLPNAPSA